jgi:hypothetical protein
MNTAMYLWPLLMVAALIATAMILKYYSKRRLRRKKGLKQHPRPPKVT